MTQGGNFSLRDAGPPFCFLGLIIVLYAAQLWSWWARRAAMRAFAATRHLEPLGDEYYFDFPGEALVRLGDCGTPHNGFTGKEDGDLLLVFDAVYAGRNGWRYTVVARRNRGNAGTPRLPEGFVLVEERGWRMVVVKGAWPTPYRKMKPETIARVWELLR